MSGTSEPAPRSLHVVGLVGWMVILGLALAWEGLGLAFAREGWPSMSDLLRSVSRPVVGRWVVLALWLWLGWHLFVRGWQPLLRGTPPASAISQAALSVGQLLRQVVAPLLATFVAFAAVLVFGARRHAVEKIARGAQPSAPSIAGRVVITLAGGYAAFLLLVVSYYAVVANQTPAFLRAAVSGGAFITFAVALPGLLLFSAVAVLARRRSNR